MGTDERSEHSFKIVIISNQISQQKSLACRSSMKGPTSALNGIARIAESPKQGSQ